ESLADALRIELRPWRISVSLIEPGPTRTDMWGDALVEYDRMTAGLSDEHRELYAAHLAGHRKLLGRMQKRVGDPKKVVKAVDHSQGSQAGTVGLWQVREWWGVGPECAGAGKGPGL